MTNSDFGLRSRLWMSVGAIAVLIVGVGAWSGSAELTGAVVARGQLVVDGNIKKVQHLTGGIIGEILVANGRRVEAGTVLMRLDDAQTRAQHGIVAGKQVQLAAERARLESERAGAHTIAFPAKLNATDPAAAGAMAVETRLFTARAAAREAQTARLCERLLQVELEIQSLSAQERARSGELRLVSADLVSLEALWRQKLTTMLRVTTARREQARLEGEVAAVKAQVSRARAQQSEIREQLAELHQRWISEVLEKLRDVEARQSELEERRIALRDQLDRVELRAPVGGIVHDLAHHTLGGVVKPGETAMSIVPVDEGLLVEARVAPTDIDQVRVGQSTLLRLTSFNRRTTPELRGEVVHVGADLTREATLAYYAVRIRLAQALPRNVELVTGMPVESFIETEQRTALSYMLKPVTDNLARAFREQ